MTIEYLQLLRMIVNGCGCVVLGMVKLMADNNDITRC